MKCIHTSILLSFSVIASVPVIAQDTSRNAVLFRQLVEPPSTRIDPNRLTVEQTKENAKKRKKSEKTARKAAAKAHKAAEAQKNAAATNAAANAVINPP